MKVRRRSSRGVSIAISLACCSVCLANDPVPLPPGFVETRLLPSTTVPQRGGARDLAWVPDGSVMFLVQSGRGEGSRIWTYDGESWGDVPALELTDVVSTSGERGIQSVAIDPDYETNKKIWLFYNYLDSTIEPEPPAQTRLSTFVYDPATDTLSNEQVMLSYELENSFHNGGCLEFAPDGTLFMGTGDDLRWSATGQIWHELRGSILHLDRDGTGAADNPHLDGVDGDPRVWAKGIRNAFRCSVQDMGDGSYNLWFGDVGQSLWEEINIGIAGANYGWATVEGFDPPNVPGITYPFYAYPQENGGTAVIGGQHVPAEFHAPYEGDYIFADWARGEYYLMDLDETGQIVSIETWYTLGPSSISSMEFGPDGKLYVASIGTTTQNVFRYEYVGGDNRQPEANASATPSSGPAALNVSFDGTASRDEDGDLLSYHWDLGDGTTFIDGPATIAHTYASGVYEAILTVDDNDSHGGSGLSDTAPSIRIVSGNEEPTATIGSPASGLTYNAGDVITYSATATDPEEGAVPCSQFRWRGDFHHDQHTHPAFGPVLGTCSGSFTVPTVGETAPDVWYRFYVTASDTGIPLGPEGTLSTTSSVAVYPNKSFMTFESQPFADLRLTLDSASFVPPMTVEGVVNLERTIGAPALQLASDGKPYWWSAWSDGGNREHTINTPSADQTFTATFECAIGEANTLSVDKGAGDSLDLSWAAPATDPCVVAVVDHYDVYAGDSVEPTSGLGFPADPTFALLGSASTESFSYTPGAGAAAAEYFLIVPVSTDGREGHVGHYGR